MIRCALIAAERTSSNTQQYSAPSYSRGKTTDAVFYQYKLPKRYCKLLAELNKCVNLHLSWPDTFVLWQIVYLYFVGTNDVIGCPVHCSVYFFTYTAAFKLSVGESTTNTSHGNSFHIEICATKWITWLLWKSHACPGYDQFQLFYIQRHLQTKSRALIFMQRSIPCYSITNLRLYSQASTHAALLQYLWLPLSPNVVCYLSI